LEVFCFTLNFILHILQFTGIKNICCNAAWILKSLFLTSKLVNAWYFFLPLSFSFFYVQVMLTLNRGWKIGGLKKWPFIFVWITYHRLKLPITVYLKLQLSLLAKAINMEVVPNTKDIETTTVDGIILILIFDYNNICF